MTITTNKVRFDAKLPFEQKAYFEKAASTGGFRNLTEFIFAAAMEKAKAIIEEHEKIIASTRDAEIFFNAIANPPEPTKAAIEAVEFYKQHLK